MPTSPTKGFVKLLLRRAKQDWQAGKTPEECFQTLSAMVRSQLEADGATGAVTSDQGAPEAHETGQPSRR